MPDDDAPHAPAPDPDAPPVEALPPQEEFWRPPVRFGSVPVETEPLGWDRRLGFLKLYPRVNLPTQIVERVHLDDRAADLDPNHLIWGDNLHVMRQLPTASVDLVYIDPPFFSGRPYNVIWGDRNERRSFDDIWDAGMPGYLIWLNARLYEMRRLLKPTGSIYVHLDWHASHYVKVELDKIFGSERFRNEIIWGYAPQGRHPKYGFHKKHDTILYYSAGDAPLFNPQYGEMNPNTRKAYSKADEDGRYYLEVYNKDTGRAYRSYLDENKGRPVADWWVDIQSKGTTYSSKEWVGYPTQKPEALLKRIIKASSNEGDLVLDAFAGGGTTPAVAQRLGRRWIAIDQSRVAVSVTAERLKHAAAERGLEDAPVPDFRVEQWGVYEAQQLSRMPAGEFREFVLHAWGATRIGDADGAAPVHGWRNQLPVWVGEPGLETRAAGADVLAFANAIRALPEYRDAGLRDGVMLAWGFAPDAVEAAELLRERADVDVDFVRLRQLRIGDEDFREHVAGRSTDKADYGEFLTFIQPPVVSVGHRVLGGRAVAFDAGDTAVVNAGATIVNVQWDFDYDGKRFMATRDFSFARDKPLTSVTRKFDRAGVFRVACRVQDSRGGEGMWTGAVEVS